MNKVKIPQQVIEILETVQKVDNKIRQLQSAAINSAAWLAGVANKSNEVLTILGKSQEKLEKVMRGLNQCKVVEAIDKFNKYYEEIARTVGFTLKKVDKTIKEAHNILLDLGWWIYPEWSFVDLKHIIELYNAGKKQEIESEIIGYFNEERLEEILNQWKNNKKLQRRYQILEDSLWAHKQQKYTLSIPPLLSQIEGIINENSGKTGRITQRDCVKSLRSMLQNSPTRESYYQFSDTLVMFIEQILRQDFEWGKPSQKGRNPILHGHHVNYADRVFSLKLILLIDFIQNSFD